MSKRRVILASQSETRRRRLRELGIDFEVVPSNIDESSIKAPSPVSLAKKLAFLKACAVAMHYPDTVVIGADAAFRFRGSYFGKPTDRAHAKQMLQAFSGKSIRIHTGLCVIDSATNAKHISYSTAKVKFRNLTEREIDAHLTSVDPTKYAGGFHEDVLVNFAERIDGHYSAIGGMPMHQLIPALRNFGVEI